MNQQTRDYTSANRIFQIALVGHLFSILVLMVQIRRIPVATLGETLITFVFLTAAIYWLLEKRLKNYAMGAFVLSILIVLLAVGNVTIRTNDPIAEVLKDVRFEIHVVSLLFAYGAFAISFIASLLHSLLDREIQKRRFGVFYSRLPSLPFFQRISDMAVDIGLALMTIGLLLGIYNALAVWRGTPILSDPKIYAAVLTWLIYGSHFVGRRLASWGAHQLANLSLIGFSWLLFSFLIISFFFSSVHDFS